MRPSRSIDSSGLGARMEALPGLVGLREAAAGFDAYLVGGAVRDLLLGEARADLDLAVEGDVGALAQKLGGELLEHERFATATVRDGDLAVDLARTRAESYPEPGALPEVRPAPIAEDLARRDFTVNAMAVPLTGDPELIDPHGGLEDLGAGVLRVLHPASFADDPTRALRAARYAARLSFELEPETEELLRKADLGTVSAERVDAELRRIAAEQEPGKALALLRDWGVASANLDHEGPERAARVADLAASPPWLGWVDRELAVMLAAGKPLPQVRELAAADPTTASEAVRLAGASDPAQLIVARAAGGEWLDRYAAEWRHVKLEIGGGDLMEAGVPEGPAVGRGLDAALAAKLDGELSGREAELEKALEAAREGE